MANKGSMLFHSCHLLPNCKHLAVSEWLVRIGSSLWHRLQRHTAVPLTLVPMFRLMDAFIRIWRLFDKSLALLVAVAGAAACGDEPEEAGTDRERGCDPDDGEHLCGHRCFDVVYAEEAVYSASHGTKERGGGYG